MSKDKTEGKTAKAAKETVAAEATEPKAPRGVMLTLKDGKQVRRLDYIRELWAAKTHTRGEIKTAVVELGGVDIPYQIVFAATKGLEGGRVVVKEPKAPKEPKAAKAAKETKAA